jgi:hypothetical protein
LFLYSSCEFEETKPMEETEEETILDPNSVRFSDEIFDLNGLPLQDVKVSLWADDVEYIDFTSKDGKYLLDVKTNDFPTNGQIIMTVSKKTFKPVGITYDLPLKTGNLYFLSSNFSMKSCPTCLTVTNNLRDGNGLFHFGDDSYSGSNNSQFQKSTDTQKGLRFTFEKPVTNKIRIRLKAKGLQADGCNGTQNHLLYNGKKFNFPGSNINGAFTSYTVDIDIASGILYFDIVPFINCGGDIDDWEMAGLYVESI